MTKWLLLSASVVLLPVPAMPQRIQNMDMSISAGPYTSGSSTIQGSNVKVDSARGFGFATRYGYQIARTRPGSLWLEFGQTFLFPGTAKATVPGSVLGTLHGFTAGLRLMIPLNARVSLYAASGGGIANDREPVLNDGANPTVTSRSRVRGLFAFGGGVDVRLTHRLSVRAEVRDLVTGRHHLAPLIGIASHF